jgi:hypothetical protein
MAQTDSEGSSDDGDNAAEEVEAPGADKGLFDSEPRAPSWRGAAFGGIAFVTGYVLLNLLVIKSSTAFTWIGAGVAFLFYIPFSYYIDRWLYRRHLAKSAAARKSAS